MCCDRYLSIIMFFIELYAITPRQVYFFMGLQVALISRWIHTPNIYVTQFGEKFFFVKIFCIKNMQ